jgi:hypothetical protein
MEQKCCSSCGEVKDIGEFSSNGYDTYGNPRLRSSCKTCEVERIKSYRKQNPTYTKNLYQRKKQERRLLESVSKESEEREETLKEFSLDVQCVDCSKTFRVITLPEKPGDIALLCKQCASRRQGE